MRPKRRVALGELAEPAFEGRDVERAADPGAADLVVGAGGAIEAVEEPQPLLRERARSARVGGLIRKRRRLRGRSAAAPRLDDGLGQRGYGRRLEKIGEADLREQE